jgi:xylulokinase
LAAGTNTLVREIKREAAVLVAGIDSSTQSTKVVLCDADDGTIVASGSAPHPDGTEIDPAHWLTALKTAGAGILERSSAVSVAAQQHGMVALDEHDEPVRPALLWNDTRSAPQAAALISRFGGPARWAEATGSVPVASFTVTKLAWMAEHEPANAARTAAVLLPHDWLTWQLGGRRFTTDRGDASGTGYWSPAENAYLPHLLDGALGHGVELPDVREPDGVVGDNLWGGVLAAGTGDNMGAALGIDPRPGDVVVSIGTSGTVFTVAERPTADPAGIIAGFADATGRYLPLVCTLNAARILSVTARLLGVGLDELSALALNAEPGAGGVTLLPYLDGERTPDRPNATGTLDGLTTANSTRENLARAAVEALLCSLADAVDLLGSERVLLIGGGARSAAVARLAPGIFGVPVVVPEPAEYVALGAARQAAWALTGALPDWPRQPARSYEGPKVPQVRERYAALRDATIDWRNS